METEKVFLNHDNPIRLVCKENSSAIDTSALTKVTITLNAKIKSVDAATGYIRWNQVGYESGEVRLYLGLATVLEPAIYNAPLVLFDTVSTNGIVWGTVPIQVLNDPEGSSST